MEIMKKSYNQKFLTKEKMILKFVYTALYMPYTFLCMPQPPHYAKFISGNSIHETCEMTFKGIFLCKTSVIQFFAYMYVILII